MVVNIGFTDFSRRATGSQEITSKMDRTVDTDGVTLYDIKRYYDCSVVKGKLRPVIGNDNLKFLPVLCWAIQDTSLILRGEAGSAKSELMKAIIVLIFGDNGLDGENSELYLLDKTSKEALVQECEQDKVNDARLVFIPELQNVEEQFWILKKWGEGSIAQKSTSSVGRGKKNIRIRLLPKSYFTTLAEGNEDLKELKGEMDRRMISGWTVASIEINTEVHNMIAKNDAMPDEMLNVLSEEDIMKLRTKIHMAMDEKRRIINPYGPFVQKILPKRFTASNTFIRYFLDSITAVTKFHAKERHGTDKYLFSSLEDNYLAIEACGDTFINLSMGIQDTGRQIVNKMPSAHMLTFGGDDGLRSETTSKMKDDPSFWDVDRVMDLQSNLGFPRRRDTTTATLSKLVEAGYLKSGIEGKTTYYYHTEDMEDKPTIDWVKAKEEGLAWMEEYWPLEYEEWKVLNSESTIHPITGKETTIC